MRNSSPVPVTAALGSSEAHAEGQDPVAPGAPGRGATDREQAALGPIPEPLSEAQIPVPAPLADSPAEAQGRRTLSTAFVRVGPGGHLAVELRNGSTIALRDVVMRRKDYCGVHVLGGSAGTRYCGGYGEVAAARPGAAPGPDEPNPAVLNPLKAGRNPSERE
jgi:hypothetical protein